MFVFLAATARIALFARRERQHELLVLVVPNPAKMQISPE